MKFIACYILFAFFALTGSSVLAHPDISQSLAKLKHVKSDSEKMEIYRDIFHYYQFANTDSCIYYLQNGLKDFTASKYKFGIASMEDLLGIIDMNQGRMDLARKRENEALQVFRDINNRKQIASTNNDLGVVEARTGNFEAATKYFMEALREFESLKNNKGIRSTYIKLGTVNEQCNNLDKAMDYYNKAKDMIKNGPDSNEAASEYDNIGIIYGKKGNFDSAIKYFEMTLQKTQEPAHLQLHISALNNIGEAYDDAGDEDEALVHYNEALALSKKANIPEEYARTILNMSAIIGRSDPARAIDSIKSSISITKRIGQKQLQIEGLQAMIILYKKQGNYKEAFSALESQTMLQDSVFNLGKAKEIANLQSEYELEKSNAKIEELESRYSRNMHERNTIVTIAACLTIIILGLLFFYWKINVLNEQLFKHEAELENTNRVKDKLFSVIGHDLRGPIGNIPVILELYKDDALTTEEKTFLLDSVTEHSIASSETLDKLLYWGQSQIKGIGIQKTVFKASNNLKSVLSLVKRAAEAKSIAITDNVPTDTVVNADPAHFDFIIRNLLSNAIKFTHANGSIKINADTKRERGFVVFSIQDDGTGMDQEQQSHIFEPFSSSTLGTANERGTSIGLMLCKEFVTENGGRIWVESEKGKGSTFYFSLMLAA